MPGHVSDLGTLRQAPVRFPQLADDLLPYRGHGGSGPDLKVCDPGMFWV
jgi:hypothetical protein